MNDAIARQPPGEQRGDAVVPDGPGRAAEHDGVDRQAPSPGGGDLAPPGVARVPGLHAEQAREPAEQVVPRVEDATALDRRGAQPHGGAHDPVVHRNLGEPEDVAHAVVFLAAPESGWITAQLLTVDGGRMDYIGHG